MLAAVPVTSRCRACSRLQILKLDPLSTAGSESRGIHLCALGGDIGPWLRHNVLTA